MLTHIIDPDRLRADDMIALPSWPPFFICSWCEARVDSLILTGASEICPECAEKVREFFK